MRRYAALMHQLPRHFHSLGPEEQLTALAEPPPLTNTCWNAFLAAVVVHIARIHDDPVPEWVDEPARFPERPWVIAANPLIAADSREAIQQACGHQCRVARTKTGAGAVDGEEPRRRFHERLRGRAWTS